jgi:hypothetical protein
MKEDILSKVVEVEKEIAKKIEIEKTEDQERLEKLGSDSEKEILKENKRLQYALNKAASDIKTDAQKKALKIIEDASVSADRLEQISDDILKEIIMKHIVRILP